MTTAERLEKRICHFSDLHLPISKRVPLWRLMGKRALGLANLKLNRQKTYRRAAFENLLEHLVAEAADLVVMTGDLANLSLEFEWELIDSLFRGHGLTPENTLVIPGNHDRYTVYTDARGAFERGMADWLPQGFSRDQGYPIVRDLGPVAVIGLSTAVWRNPIRAAGHLDPAQIERLTDVLDDDSLSSRWPVIAMHHPPFHLGTARLRNYLIGLDTCESLLGALGSRQATVLHGHLHKLSRRRLGNLDVIGVPSASNDSGEASTQLAYHVYTFSSSGLVRGEVVRHWPGERDEQRRFERMSLPEELEAD